MPRIGTRAQVMHGTAIQTGGGLKKKDLKYNKQGKIVSKKMSAIAKKEKRLQKAGYTTKKGVFGAVKINNIKMYGGNGGNLRNEFKKIFGYNKELLGLRGRTQQKRLNQTKKWEDTNYQQWINNYNKITDIYDQYMKELSIKTDLFKEKLKQLLTFINEEIKLKKSPSDDSILVVKRYYDGHDYAFKREASIIFRLHSLYPTTNFNHLATEYSLNSSDLLIMKDQYVQLFIPLKKYNIFDFSKTYEIKQFEELANQLTTIHRLGIVHRDIFKDNIMIKNNDIVLIDFDKSHIFDTTAEIIPLRGDNFSRIGAIGGNFMVCVEYDRRCLINFINS